MKTDQKVNEVERGGAVGESAGYTMLMNAKAVKALSQSIYKDPVAAVIRELSTNAADSHVDAGVPTKPFDVHLPNQMEPEFWVRDYGTGMSHKKCMTLYAQYFGSDKEDSNDFTGYIGIGSKSPFAKVDQFTATSWYQGEKRSYTIFKDTNGIPKIENTFTGPSTEPSGFEVRLAVQAKDYETYRVRAIEIYKWFTVKPKITGRIIDAKELQRPPAVLSGKGWSYSSKESHSSGMATGTMGNVHYPINASDLRGHIGDTLLAAMGGGLVFDLPIGDVDVTIGRESLEYTEKTFTAIKSRLKDIIRETDQLISDKLSAQPNMWAARCQMKEMRGNWFVGQNMHGRTLTYKGENIEETIKLEVGKPPAGGQGLGPRKVAAQAFTVNTSYRGKQDLHFEQVDRIEADPQTEFFLDDAPTHPHSRIKFYLSGKNAEKRDQYSYGSSHSITAIVMSDEKMTVDKFVAQEGMKLKKLSDLPLPPPGQSGYKRTAQVLKLTTVGTYDHEWKHTDVDDGTGGHYVEVFDQSGRACEGGPYLSPTNLIENINETKPLHGMTMNDLVGVRSKVVKKFRRASQWISLGDVIKAKLAEQKATTHRGATEALIWNRNFIPLQEWLAGFKGEQLAPGSPFTRFVHIVEKLQASSKNKGYVTYLAGMEFVGQAYDKSLPDFEKEKKSLLADATHILARYPLLEALSNSAKLHKTDVLEYIRMVDAANRKSNKLPSDKTSPTTVVAATPKV